MRWEVGFDLGTQTVRMTELKEGFVLETASRLAYREGKDNPICFGDSAARLEGRTCQGVEVFAPLKDGMLESDYYAERLIRCLLRQRGVMDRVRRFGTMITCAPFTRPVQREALMEAAVNAGAAEAALIRSDAAAAIGAGLDLSSPEAKLVVDIGAGKITCTLFTFGRVAAFGFLPYGLARIDERIQRIMRTESGFRIGIRSAREIKHTLGTALPEHAPKDIIMRMTGFSLERRLPEVFDVETEPVLHACEEVVSEIAGLCVSVVSEAPEELAADLNDEGIVLVGRGAELPGIDKRLGDTLGVPCTIADTPGKCAVRGLYEIMLHPEKYPVAILDSSRKGGK